MSENKYVTKTAMLVYYDNYCDGKVCKDAYHADEEMPSMTDEEAITYFRETFYGAKYIIDNPVDYRRWEIVHW
jgi:hypothetical protein